jgi:hypothetical protein
VPVILHEAVASHVTINWTMKVVTTHNDSRNIFILYVTNPATQGADMVCDKHSTQSNKEDKTINDLILTTVNTIMTIT